MPRQIQLHKQDDYETLKEAIHYGLDAWYKAAKAADEIRRRNLWKSEYETWAEFVKQEFGQSARRIYQFMEAAKVVDMLPGTDLNESQARALVGSTVEEAENILVTIENSGTKITAKKIKAERGRRADTPVVAATEVVASMADDLDSIVADITIAIAGIRKCSDDKEYYMVKKAWPRINAARRALASAIEWGKLTHACPLCGAKPHGCQHCNGTGLVNDALVDNRDARL
jgi:hypothetical protein